MTDIPIGCGVPGGRPAGLVSGLYFPVWRAAEAAKGGAQGRGPGVPRREGEGTARLVPALYLSAAGRRRSGGCGGCLFRLYLAVRAGGGRRDRRRKHPGAPGGRVVLRLYLWRLGDPGGARAPAALLVLALAFSLTGSACRSAAAGRGSGRSACFPLVFSAAARRAVRSCTWLSSCCSVFSAWARRRNFAVQSTTRSRASASLGLISPVPIPEQIQFAATTRSAAFSIGGSGKAHRPVAAARVDALEAEFQRRRVAAQRQFDRPLGDVLRVALEQSLDDERFAVARADRPPRRVAAFALDECHLLLLSMLPQLSVPRNIYRRAEAEFNPVSGIGQSALP